MITLMIGERRIMWRTLYKHMNFDQIKNRSNIIAEKNEARTFVSLAFLAKIRVIRSLSEMYPNHSIVRCKSVENQSDSLRKKI